MGRSLSHPTPPFIGPGTATSNAERLYTEAEYLVREDAATERSEYVNGRVYAMSGASSNHSRIAVNVTRELATQLRGTPCDTFDNEMRVKVGPTRAYFYPDATALCGEPQFEGTGVPMLVNPTVVVEILSPSSAAFDRGEQFEHYRQIPSLRFPADGVRTAPRLLREDAPPAYA